MFTSSDQLRMLVAPPFVNIRDWKTHGKLFFVTSWCTDCSVPLLYEDEIVPISDSDYPCWLSPPFPQYFWLRLDFYKWTYWANERVRGIIDSQSEATSIHILIEIPQFRLMAVRQLPKRLQRCKVEYFHHQLWGGDWDKWAITILMRACSSHPAFSRVVHKQPEAEMHFSVGWSHNLPRRHGPSPTLSNECAKLIVSATKSFIMICQF